MKCPRDSWELREGDIDGVPAHRCPKCDGLFLELRGDRRLSFDPEKLKGAAWESPKKGDLISPASGKPMRVFHYRGVELDYCEVANAIWLDRGEWEKLIGKTTNIGQGSHPTKSRDQSNQVLDGLDVTFIGFDIVDFIGDAVSSLFDAF